MVNGDHLLLFVLPLLTAGITTFYMFRMWFMTFTGKPRDQHVHDNAHESPYVMTVPLIILAFFAVVVAWGWPMWDPEASLLEGHIHHGQPRSVQADFGVVPETDTYYHPEDQVYLKGWPGGPTLAHPQNVRLQAHQGHSRAGLMALGMAALGFAFAYAVYYRRVVDTADAKEQFPGLFSFLRHKWFFDELYSVLLVRPALAVAGWCRSFDTRVIDGVVDGTAKATVNVSRGSGRFDNGIIDGLANLTARVFYGLGAWLRHVQTGYLRSYVVFLVVAAVGIWVILTALLGRPPAQPPTP
jgi:NADH-quinone oxidoreductase subunit L